MPDELGRQTPAVANWVEPSGGAKQTVAMPHPPVKIDPALLRKLTGHVRRERYPCIIEVVGGESLASHNQIAHGQDRHLQLIRQLQTTSTEAQTELLAFLLDRQAVGRVQQIRPFWIVNAVAVTADAETILAIASRPEVRVVREDAWLQWVDPFAAQESQSEADESNPEWNVARIQADLAWSALDLDGDGVTIAIMDTGVDWQHPALQTQYRGYKAGGLPVHAGNWFCATDEAYIYPYDGHGHGTHVTGTAVGGTDPTGTAFGVAPGAHWIAVKALDDQGYAYESWLHAAFEWIMAPAGDPSLAPDVVNASWGSRNGLDESLRPDIQALRAAGIVPVFSAGNEGPSASSLRSPASYPEAIAVGATDDIDKIAGFSSRGPSPWDETKPEVVAPGTQIRSTLPGGSFGIAGGTSMAAPHVSGLVALLLQADPTLTVERIETILTSTTEPLSESVPNNDAGWGRIDAYRAASSALAAGHIVGQITRHPDLAPLPIAQITARDDMGERRATVKADELGHYQIALPAGRYSVRAEAFGYVQHTEPSVTVQAATTSTVNLTLSPQPSGVLWGRVANAETDGPVGAQLTIADTPAQTTSDAHTGQYSLVLPAGTYTVTVSQNGYRLRTLTDVEIQANESAQQDIALVPAPSLLLVDSGPWYYRSQRPFFERALRSRDYAYDLWQIRDLSADLPSATDLGQYDVVIWSSPLDAPGLIGAGDALSGYLTGGGNLLLTGQDVGFWDGGLSAFTWHDYYGSLLKAAALDDNAGLSPLVGLPEEPLRDLVLPFNGPDSAQNQTSPDSIGVTDTRYAALIGGFEDGGYGALRSSACQSYRALYLSAGLEGLGDGDQRAEVLDRSIAWLAAPQPEVAMELFPARQEQVWLAGTSVTYTVELRNMGSSTDRYAIEMGPADWTVSVWDGSFTMPISQSLDLGACQTQTLGIKVEVPPEVTWNVTDSVTITVRSMMVPTSTAQASFHHKAPAPILLVDDHRWYDTSGSYRQALDEAYIPHDLWRITTTPLPDSGSPALAALQRYPVVVWFTAYDWYNTLTEAEESVLAKYLEGGGRLLLSSQDFLYTNGVSDFAESYLGVAGFTEGVTVTQIMGAVDSPIGLGFETVGLTYPFPNWSDALRARPNARIALWSTQGQPAALSMAGPFWKSAFFAFPLEALSDSDLANLLEQALGWLSPLGDSSFSAYPRTVHSGGTLTYTLEIQNTGPAILSNVVLSVTIPPSTTLLPESLSGPAEYDPTTHRIGWTGSLTPGQSITVGYALALDLGIGDGSTIQSVASLCDESGLTLELVAGTWVNAPDLSASSKLVTEKIGVPGQALTFTLILRNDGLRPSSATLVDSVPPGLSLTGAPPWASSGQLTLTEGLLLWTGQILQGQPVTITVPTAIGPSTVGRYVHNRASLADGWGRTIPLEAYTWAEMRLHLPMILNSVPIPTRQSKP